MICIGTKDQWESATMGYQNIGPTLWEGETGRKDLIKGSAKYNQGGFLAAFDALAKWRPYLGPGYQALAYADSQNLFAQGRGAIYPAGSWDIGVFRQMNPKLDLGAFKPYTFESKTECIIDDHPDIALGINAASKNKEAARTFLSWIASAEFAQLYPLLCGNSPGISRTPPGSTRPANTAFIGSFCPWCDPRLVQCWRSP